MIIWFAFGMDMHRPAFGQWLDWAGDAERTSRDWHMGNWNAKQISDRFYGSCQDSLLGWFLPASGMLWQASPYVPYMAFSRLFLFDESFSREFLFLALLFFSFGDHLIKCTVDFGSLNRRGRRSGGRHNDGIRWVSFNSRIDFCQSSEE